MLILKIENYDRLADGGPIVYRADRRGFDIGRAQYLDWTLPDLSLFISSKHCEIRFQDGGYWLHDVSTNGTIVNKSDRRVQSPYLLADGDELQIGDYIISVSIAGLDASKPKMPAQSSPVAAGEVWAGTEPPLPPIRRQDLMPPVQRQSRAADFLSSVADIPAAASHGHEWPALPAADVRSPPVQMPDWSTPSQVHRNGKSMGPGAREKPLVEVAATPPAELAVPPAREPQPLPQAPPPAPPDALRAQIERAFIQQFAAGANIPETLLAGRNSIEFAHELGLILRVVCANLMQLLSARAAAKVLARAGDRTLIQARDNNPLKFMPTPEEALRVILGPKSSSYLDARQTFEQTFADLKAHELATFAAMQQAFIMLLQDFAPEAIEKAGTGSKKVFLGSNKTKFWDLFTERWNTKAASRENGMLDAFLDIFADVYEHETQRRR